MESDLVNDSKLPVRFSAKHTHHVIFESNTRAGQQVRRKRREETWEKVKHLGRGGFGSVWLEKCSRVDSQPKTRAVKAIPKSTPFSQVIDYKRELQAIAKFSHRKYEGLFVKSFGWYEDESFTYIAMEYFELGDLQQYLVQPLPELEAQQIAYQLLEGLEQLHLDGYAHRDLKPENIFVIQKSPDWWVKIGDFGISKRVNEGKTILRTVIGTPGFIAPEMLVNDSDAPDFQYSEKVDIWSLGILVHYMITKTLPFDTERKLREYMKNSHFPQTDLASSDVSGDCHDFVINALLTTTAANRMSSSDALQHRWLRDLNAASSNEEASEVNVSIYELNAKEMDEKDREMTSEVASLSLKSTDASARWSAQDETERPITVPVKTQGRTEAKQKKTSKPPESKPPTELPASKASHSNAPASKSPVSKPPASGKRHSVLNLRGNEVPNDSDINSLYDAGRSALSKKEYKEAETLFHQVLKRREELLGPEHKDTIDSTFWLGYTVYHLNKESKEAERLFRRNLTGKEKQCGPDDENTIYAAKWLAFSLEAQNKHKDAEKMLRRVLQGREKLNGHSDAKTLNAAYLLGISLRHQRKDEESEKMLRRSLEGREKLYGHDAAVTLEVAYWLGTSLHRLKKDKEAEEMFRRSLEGREKLYGHDASLTIDVACWLGTSLQCQNKDQEAEILLRRALEGRQRDFGPDSAYTLDVTIALGTSLYCQEKNEEAENFLRRAVEGTEKLYGYDAAETLDAAEWLGKTLYSQKYYKEAKELFQRCEKGLEKLVGTDHEDTESARRWAVKANNKIRHGNVSD